MGGWIRLDLLDHTIIRIQINQIHQGTPLDRRILLHGSIQKPESCPKANRSIALSMRFRCSSAAVTSRLRKPSRVRWYSQYGSNERIRPSSGHEHQKEIQAEMRGKHDFRKLHRDNYIADDLQKKRIKNHAAEPVEDSDSGKTGWTVRPVGCRAPPVLGCCSVT
jgi:hypothetical protein